MRLTWDSHENHMRIWHETHLRITWESSASRLSFSAGLRSELRWNVFTRPAEIARFYAPNEDMTFLRAELRLDVVAPTRRYRHILVTIHRYITFLLNQQPLPTIILTCSNFQNYYNLLTCHKKNILNSFNKIFIHISFYTSYIIAITLRMHILREDRRVNYFVSWATAAPIKWRCQCAVNAQLLRCSRA